MSSEASRVEVALPLPIHRTFTYAVDGPVPPPGTRVLVPFQRSERIGWVVGPGASGPIKGLRSLLSVLDREPTVSPELLGLCRWMSEYYVAPLGIAIRTALPSVLSDVSRDYVTWAGSTAGGATGVAALRPRARRVAEALARKGAPHRVMSLKRSLGMGSIRAELRDLERAGLIRHETVSPAEPTVRTRRVVKVSRVLGTLSEREELFGRAPRQREAYELVEAAGGSVELRHLVDEQGFSRGVVRALEDKDLVCLVDEEEIRDPFRDTPTPEAPVLVPSPAQREALDALLQALGESVPSPFLLQGITGSGKTLVYVELIREALRRGRTAIVLVPEIALTPQTVSRFRAHFDDEVAVLHSGLSEGERYDAWRMLRAGTRRVAVGARSALFAPLSELGVIVVDEEHEGSYKQSEAPRYQARDLAVMRARAAGAVCVLGSATPSLESRHNAEVGKFRRLRLPERAGGATLPTVKVVDLRVLKREADGKRTGLRSQQVFSPELVDAVRARLQRKEQTILLLNRRGYSSFVQCRECGEVERCDNCSISLTYHRVTQRIICHHCRFEAPAPSRCPRCGGTDLSYRGLGTEQVERVAAETFPEARIARMDVDTTSGRWGHQRILDRFERHEIDVLLGTQMIAKGLDFPRVTLVGVVNADIGLHMPDFRASERTFQLLSQVAGRSGRGSVGGEVLIQTSMPEHYTVQAALAHDYERFAQRELKERKAPRYPPYVRLANVLFSSPDQELAARAAESAAAWFLRQARRGRADLAAVELVGPAPAPIERLHNRWRWHFLLRSRSAAALSVAARALVTRHRLPAGDVRLALDRDPVALL